MQLTLGSLFDGIGGWQLAAINAGIIPVWSSEIETFPCELTSKHFPNTKQLGDITKIDGAKIESVDIICAGSPCQDLSIAGKRKGLDGERSGLFKAAIDIVRDMRASTKNKYPRFFVWENVPGAFSSNKGNDFRAVLEEITESKIPMPRSNRWAHAGMVRSNSCEVAWRVLDAQYWGVPQRRKRIFLVADFTGQRASEILFKPESMSGNPEKSSGERESTAGSTTNCLGTTIKLWDMTHADEVMHPVKDGIVPTLNARMGTGGNQVPVIQESTYSLQGNTIDRTPKQNGSGVSEGTAHTLNTTDRRGIAYALQGSMIGCADKNGPQGNGINKDVCFTLNTVNRHAVEYNYKVRRLTPTECERLQGLNDGYTEGGSDSARYKALGNGMAQPCADFVIKAIMEVENATK